MKLKLIRIYGQMGTNGYLIHEREVVCKTIELPWKQNQPSVSCIPEGEYQIRKRRSARFGLHLEVVDVPNRSHILFHPANLAWKELRGCIAPVMELSGEGMGLYSRVAMQRLMDLAMPILDNGQLLTLKIYT
jgi:hypothetical protein